MTNPKQQYRQKAVSQMKKEFGYTNDLAVPKLIKVVVSIGTGDRLKDKGLADFYINTLIKIAGQKPVITKARHAIAGFKIREGMQIGLKVTLRGQRMYDFVDKLVNIVLPRVRDFRGLSKKSFDGKGNLNIGLKEQTVFPESATGEKADKVFGLQITIVTSTENDQEAYGLLRALGFPLR